MRDFGVGIGALSARAGAQGQCDSQPKPRRRGLIVRESADGGLALGMLVRSGMMICVERAPREGGVEGGERSTGRFAPGVSKAEEGIGGTGGGACGD